MGLPTENLCRSMLDQFDDHMDTLNNAKSAYASQMSNLITDLTDAIYSPINDVQDAIDEALGRMDEMVPDLSTNDTYNEVMDLVNNCPYFDGLGAPFADAVVLFRNMTSGILNGADAILSSIFAAIPELPLAEALNALLAKLGGLQLGPLVIGMDELLTCLSALCGTDVQSRITSMDNLLGEMRLNSAGELKIEEIYDVAGMTQNAKDSVNNVKATVDTVSSNIETSVDDGVAFAKTTGGSFYK